LNASRPRPVQQALEFIGESGAAWAAGRTGAPGSPGAADAAFDRVARDVFAFQAANNAPYGRFCRRRGVLPEAVDSWEAIPPVPAAAFKDVELTAGRWTRVFTTSGTTRGSGKRGRHLLPELALYEASWVEPFRRHLLPDRDAIVILSLIPPLEVLPQSSLSFMADRAVRRFGIRGSGWFLGADGLDDGGLHEAATRSETSGEPVLLLGTALAFLQWKSVLEISGRRYALPPGSRIMDTGGFKGRVREASRDLLLEFYADRLGVPWTHVAGEYGMTELCSQFYEPSLALAAAGVHAPQRARTFMGPPWTRTRVLDPDILAPLPHGQPGLLAHWDLANAWTVLAVVTEDLGVWEGGGFRLLGRAAGAELRGCSLATEELLGA
jgi:hypothetical protein